MSISDVRAQTLTPSSNGDHLNPFSPNYSYVFGFERRFNHASNVEWMGVFWHTSFYWVAAYMLVIFGGQAYMANRPALKLRRALALWNTLLAAFSIAGALRTLPEMIHVLSKFGFYHSVCNPSYVESVQVSAYWTWLFTLSKVPELGDTVFIVLRKQNLIFLHWYHHITVLLFTWFSYSRNIAPGRWYVCMNYVVHSLMYTYYAARALGYRPPKRLAMVITTSQIVQMILGAYVTYYAYEKQANGELCAITQGTAKLGLIMYLSYFMLFARFFINSYLFNAPATKASRPANGALHQKSQ